MLPPKPGIDENGWRKASYSIGNGECVEAAPIDAGGVAVRDSRNPGAGIVMNSVAEWETFLRVVKSQL